MAWAFYISFNLYSNYKMCHHFTDEELGIERLAGLSLVILLTGNKCRMLIQGVRLNGPCRECIEMV